MKEAKKRTTNGKTKSKFTVKEYMHLMQTMMGNPGDLKPCNSKKHRVKFDKSDSSNDEERIFMMSNILADIILTNQPIQRRRTDMMIGCIQ